MKPESTWFSSFYHFLDVLCVCALSYGPKIGRKTVLGKNMFATLSTSKPSTFGNSSRNNQGDSEGFNLESLRDSRFEEAKTPETIKNNEHKIKSC